MTVVEASESPSPLSQADLGLVIASWIAQPSDQIDGLYKYLLLCRGEFAQGGEQPSSLGETDLLPCFVSQWGESEENLTPICRVGLPLDQSFLFHRSERTTH